MRCLRLSSGHSGRSETFIAVLRLVDGRGWELDCDVILGLLVVGLVVFGRGLVNDLASAVSTHDPRLNPLLLELGDETSGTSVCRKTGCGAERSLDSLFLCFPSLFGLDATVGSSLPLICSEATWFIFLVARLFEDHLGRFFFFLMMLRPPQITLFPYTTLFTI